MLQYEINQLHDLTTLDLTILTTVRRSRPAARPRLVRASNGHVTFMYLKWGGAVDAGHEGRGVVD